MKINWKTFLEKAKPLPNAWHSNFRNPKTLPNLQIEFAIGFLKRLTFVCCIVLVLAVAVKWYRIQDLSDQIQEVEAFIEAQNKANFKQLATSALFREKSAKITTLYNTFFPAVNLDDFLLELSDLQTGMLRFHEVSIDRRVNFSTEVSKPNNPRNPPLKNKPVAAIKVPFFRCVLVGQVNDIYDFALDTLDALKTRMRGMSTLKGWEVKQPQLSELRRKDLADKQEMIAFVLTLEID
ncbi:MAG: hypothetical protein A2Y14_05390 [Verrucomicrobia bacterium GWF2_51_19]|nr:MAG: hypothetical protein A2Y14_05390 [Verrucomicrobia bacterium GWF2_51_19]HCJ12443.1 hypothetical protein [Opitutae bacterium]